MRNALKSRHPSAKGLGRWTGNTRALFSTMARRRSAAKTDAGVPHRFHRANPGRSCPAAGAARAGRAGANGLGSISNSSGRDDALALLVRPAVRQDHATTRLYQGLSAGRSRGNGGPVTRMRRPWTVMAFAALGGRRQGRKRSSRLPQTRSTTPRNPAPDVIRYKVEPYVVSADIYSVAPHVGRGGLDVVTRVRPGWLQRAGASRRPAGPAGSGAQGCGSIPAFPRPWPRYQATLKISDLAVFESLSRNPKGPVCRGVVASRGVDGIRDRGAGRCAFALLDDGRPTPRSTVRLG